MLQPWSTTIVATPITNVKILLKKILFFFNIDFVKDYDISSNFQQSLPHFFQLNYDNCEILWHTIRLSYNGRNFDIEIVTIVKYLKSLLCQMKKNSDICDYSVFKYDRWWISLWSVELMAKGSSAVVERLVIKYIVWLKTLILVVNRVMVGKKARGFW